MTYKFDDEIECFLVARGVMPAATLGLLHRILSNVTLFSSQGSRKTTRRVGVDDGEGTPVPIPNTAVKLTRADNTWLEAAW